MIESSYFWTNILILAVGTLAIRGSIIAMSKRIVLSDRLKELFSYIPAAILPAFVAPAVFFHQGSVTMLMGKERLVILLLSAWVCIFFRNTLVTVLFGLVSLYLVTQLGLF
jgi:branched-subunit amino acid transport protein